MSPWEKSRVRTRAALATAKRQETTGGTFYTFTEADLDELKQAVSEVLELTAEVAS